MERLLLVEDDPTLIRMLSSFLASEGFAVTPVTANGRIWHWWISLWRRETVSVSVPVPKSGGFP